MEIFDYYLTVFKKYAVFNGRAQRAEYWYFLLFNVIIYILCVGMDFIIGIGLFKLLYGLYSLVIMVPALALVVRRLHDTNHSGWWWFIGLIPFVGAIILLVFLLRDSQPGQNQYGHNPKESMIN